MTNRAPSSPKKQARPPAQAINSLSLIHATIHELQTDRDKWRGLTIKLGISQMITVAGLMLVVGVLILHHPNTYFATSPTGQITPLVPLEKPTVTSTAVQRFAVSTLTDSLSLNFRQWRGQLGRVEQNYTAAGYQSFIEQLEKTNWIKSLEDGYFTASATEISRPVLVAQGMGANGVYGYVIEIPMTLTLENQNERRRQALKAKVIVVRVPTSEKPDGIAVDKVFVS